jgi:carboxypeptidase C (cathepsin A)
MFMDYVRNELKWQSDLHYDSRGSVRPWTYEQNRYMDMTEALRSTMARNPFLKVLVLAGYYDMATPFHGIEINMWHLAYDAFYTDRVQFAYYEGGHMMYTRPLEHRKLKQDLKTFVAATAGAAHRTDGTR